MSLKNSFIKNKKFIHASKTTIRRTEKRRKKMTSSTFVQHIHRTIAYQKHHHHRGKKRTHSRTQSVTHTFGMTQWLWENNNRPNH